MTSIASEKAGPVHTGAWAAIRSHARLLLLLAVVSAWVVAWAFTRGDDTLPLPALTTTPLHDSITAQFNNLQLHANQYIVMQATQQLGDWFNALIGWFQTLVSTPALPRPVPQVGWFGVIALAGWVSLVAAGWRIGLLVVLSFLSFGVLGYWNDSMDTLVVTFTAVALSCIVGLPLGVWMGNSKAVSAVVTPVLDVMQTIPPYVYLLPMVLFFQIGSASALVATFIYAVPPVVRITAHGIKGVSSTAIEATDSAGQTARQRLTKVQVPMARRTIVVGINQTTMAALSMVTIAALIAGPGLGIPVVEALSAQKVGQAFVAGLCIVIMAIMLDRATTAASQRPEKLIRNPGNKRLRLAVNGGAALVTVVAVYLSRTYLQLADFGHTNLVYGGKLQGWVQSAANWISVHLSTVTNGIKDAFSYVLLNPVQDLVANSPWWLIVAVMLAIALILGGGWAFVASVVCLTGIRLLGVWQDAMVTMTMVLAATILVMALAAVFGVWMGRSRTADGLLRPILDAGQTMPPFVYLVPVLALFGPTRFTAIIAAIVYAAPAAIKLVADGISGVSPTAVEAATATGSTRWQIITKVQIPMARSSFVLAANQGLLYVLSMVVIGGLVGGGALGFDIVAGFSQLNLYGKGVAAGATIVLLGVMLDRITRRAATRGTTSGGSAVGYA